MNQAIVLDNILPNRLVDDIEKELLSPSTPYFFNDRTTSRELDLDEIDNPQWTHVAYTNDPNYTPITPLWNSLSVPLYFAEQHLNIEVESIERVKVNFMTKCHNTQSHHPWHQDVPVTGYTSIIYYANDAQGKTLFKEGTVNNVEPKKGRMVLFPSNMLHCGSPTTSAKRLVVNYIVKVKQ